MKKFILILLAMLLVFPDTSYAARTITMYDPGNTVTKGPYYDKAVDWIRYDFSGTKFKIARWEYYGNDSSMKNMVWRRDVNAKAGQYWNQMSFACVGYYKHYFYDAAKNLLVKFEVEVHAGDVGGTKCTDPPDPPGTVYPSYPSDPPDVPDPPDPDPPDPPDDGKGCGDSCAIFNCPGWKDYMGKLDDIKSAIPGPPDWHEVAEVFSDAIVPRLVDETRDMLDELLGEAPEPPPVMPDLPKLDDHKIEQQKPTMPNVPGLEGFNEKDIKDGAPVIQFEDDPTGGFDLIVDPMNNLPDVVPGGDPGVYKRDPKEPQNDFPGKPADKNIDTGNAPKPGNSTAVPPTPGGSIGTPPTPGGGIGTPPTPGGSIGNPGSYKPNP